MPRPILGIITLVLLAGGSNTVFSADEAAKPAEAITNSLGQKLVLIPVGEFKMGSPEAELARDGKPPSGEKQHTVKITKPFYLGKYTVTQEEYEQLIGSNPSFFASKREQQKRVAGLDTKRFPVELVSWKQAVEFCKKLSEKEGKAYRLPTEAEWEYACRAGTDTPFHFGNTLNGHNANCDGEHPYGTEMKGKYLNRTEEVGSYKANAFGLYDMHGNVGQWCADGFDYDYYEKSPVEDPQCAATGRNRVVRGGSWHELPADCRAAHRRSGDRFRPYIDIGFRIAMTP